jgi:trigger factor
MNLKVDPLDTHEVRLTITVDDDTIAKVRRDTARDLARRVRIPGFRPGKAPMNAVIRAVGGEQVFDAEVVDRVAREVYSKALDEAKVEPYGPGQIEEVKQSPYQLITRVPLEPSVDLKDYRSVRLPPPHVIVTDDEVEQQLQFLREENAVVQLVERPAEMGDLVEASIVGHTDDEEVFRSNNRRGIVLDEERLGIPGLTRLVVGMSAGEHKEASLTMPQDFADEALRGKDVHVHIDVQRVSSRTLPDISDELAQAASSFSTLAELREDLRNRLQEYRQNQADQDYALQALNVFTELAEVKYPPAFLADRLEDFLRDFKEDVRENQGLPFEEWLKVQGKTEEQVKEEHRPDAEQRGRRGLVMREFGRAERLNVNEDEIAAEIELTAIRYGSRQAEVRKLLAQDDTRGAVKSNILSNKVLNRMMKIAKGELPDEAADSAEPTQPAEPAEPAIAD